LFSENAPFTSCSERFISNHTDVLVNSSDELDIKKFKAWREDYKVQIHL
jgi:hypothetical protein